MSINRSVSPSIRALITFESAARHGNFRQASMELSLTQSAVSKQIRQLEEMMGIKLFERVRQRVVLTDIGRKYLDDVSRILGDLEETTHRVMASKAGAGELTISSLPTFTVCWLMPRIGDFLCRNNGIQLNMATHLLPSFHGSESYDAAIHYGTPNVPGATSCFLMSEQIVPVCSPAYRKQHGIRTLDDLNDVVLLQRTTRPNEWCDWSEHQGLRLSAPRCGPRISHFPVLTQAAVYGMGVALVPRFFIQDELKAGRLVMLFDSDYTSKSGYHLIVPDAKWHAPTVRAFRTWLLETIASDAKRPARSLRYDSSAAPAIHA
ncbi:LysR substrate-binding domain-containing protein [Reyranella sp. CPCC 100927]|uniref:LysR substrate-binding domain-containing protein n=1 Tax=Reyranella sp. CPCC 100927 TaxID=2599616 RepID=UPI0011B72E9B|nr:LysR substrate-binding domain-containing protein [Reyranella sp. CPCC 100927]TWT11599.1 LysR family transcriptional regulator [Reyranella sp. CPCC 100927]